MIARRALAAAGLLAFYAAAFLLLTYPRSALLATHFWADAGDGFTSAWNVWWVRKALLELHQSPWHTTWIYSPVGISLHAHVLGVVNGLLAIPLATVLSPVATYNTVILIAFASAGTAAFLLAYETTHSTVASLVAGWVFTFSAYHFAHMGAHLNLVAIQTLPLFIWAWLRLLDDPGPGWGVAAALALFAVYLTDYYYFGYAVGAAVVLGVWESWRARDAAFLVRRTRRNPLMVFAVTALLTTGVVVAAALRAYAETPFLGGHDPRQLSLDLLAPFVPGGHSRFRAYTMALWQRVGPNPNEASVYLGWSAVILSACAALPPRAGDRRGGVGRWYALLGVFWVLALGPRLRVLGMELAALPLPYAWLEIVAPSTRVAGAPIRAFVIVTLAVAILCAVGVRRLVARGAVGRVLAAALVTILAIETLPGTIAISAPPAPRFAGTLAAHHDDGAYVEAVDPPTPVGVALYFQTVHQHPMAAGHTSRTTAAVRENERRIAAAVAAHDWTALHCDLGFRWLATAAPVAVGDAPAPSEPVALWDGRPGRLYDLAAFADRCGAGTTR